jgi:hypothetical protein
VPGVWVHVWPSCSRASRSLIRVQRVTCACGGLPCGGAWQGIWTWISMRRIASSRTPSSPSVAWTGEDLSDLVHDFRLAL